MPQDPPRRALVIGRFQPPHRGHLHCLETAARLADRLIVVVGSAQASHTLRDPFTAGERIEMIRLALTDVDLQAEHILPVPDLNQYHLWVSQVEAYTPPFDVVVTGNPMTAILFEARGYRVERVPVQDRAHLSGTEVRRRLLAGISVTDLVTRSVAAILDRPATHARFTALRAGREGSG